MTETPKYNWSCNACKNTVQAGISICPHCGLEAGANGEATDKYRDPSAYLQAMVRKQFEGFISALIYFPIFIFALLVNNQTEKALLFFLVSLLFVILKFQNILRAFKDISYFAMCVMHSSILALGYGFKLTYFSSLDAGYIFVFFIMSCLFNFYLLKGQKGKDALVRYHLN